MSGGSQKKKIKATAATAVKPEDTAVKPKPSLHALKRPPGSVAGPSTIPVLSKKPRLDFTSGTGALGVKPGLPGGSSPPRPQLDSSWLEFCQKTTVEVETFAEQLTAAFQDQKANKAARLISAVFRLFIEKKIDAHKFFIEYHLLTTCAVTIKEHGEKLTNPYLHKCLLNILCWMGKLSADRQEMLSALVICLAEKQPALDPYYLSIFLHDSLGERIWVDKPYSSRLVSLLVKPLGTILPTKEQYMSSLLDIQYPENAIDPNVPNKFEEQDIAQLTAPLMECLKKCWAADPPNRNVLKTMAFLSGIPEVRSMAAKRMDSWSQNIKLQRSALELMMFVGCNFGSASTSEQDREALSSLLKLRNLKSKQVLTVFVIVLKEIINRHESNLKVAIQLIIANEFGPSQHRFPMNMVLLQTLFGFDNSKTTKIFAQELSSTVINREELAKHARLLTRELFRSQLRNDFNYALFAEAYLNYILEEERRSELGIEDHVVYRSATEVITMLPLVAISPQVREGANIRRSGVSLLPDLQNAMNKMEKDLSAYYEVVLKWLQYAKNLFYDSKEYYTAYYRYLFLEKSEYYTTMDQGPSENEFFQASKIFGEFCFTDRHIRLIVGEGFNTLSQEDTIELLYDLTKRATVHRAYSEPRNILSFVSDQPASSLAQRVFDVCLFRPNFSYENELLPMFVRSVYWKAWTVVMLWSCSGKSWEVLRSMHETFPMFRYLVHVMLTKQYQFPVAFEGATEEEMLEKEEEIAIKEVEALIKQENLFEKTHNRETEVTESTSQLVQACLIAQNCVRRPPEAFLAELRGFTNECHLVASLSECKDPDLLKIIIDNYGAPKAMPAIQDLVMTNSGAIDTLDILVLCEFLVFHMATDNRNRQIGEEKMQLIKTKLCSSLESEAAPLLFFLQKLASPQATERLVTHRSLCFLFDEPQEEGPYFTFSRLEGVGCFDSSKAEIGIAVANSLLFENDAGRTETAIEFAAKTFCKGNMHQIAVSMSPLADRSDLRILQTLINFYERYHTMCHEFPTEWPEKPVKEAAKYTVHLSGGDVFMASPAVHSILKLLCKSNGEAGPAREILIKVWFPENGKCPEVKEDEKPVDLFPESLRSSMLCAEDERITKVALQGITGLPAVQLLSSFGLTTFSATQLLSVVDKVPITEMGKQKALLLRTFVVAYKHRGAQGGEQFLKSLEEFLNSEMDIKEEMVEGAAKLGPPPAVEPLTITLQPKMTKAEIVQYLKEVTVPDSPALFVCSTNLVRSAVADKNISLHCTEHFEGHLKFFLANPEAFHEIMMIISNAADLYPEVHARMVSLASRLLKSAAVRPALEGYLRKFAPAAPPEKTEKHLSLSHIFDSINRTATSKTSPDDGELDKQILDIFGGQLASENFVAQIPQRYSPEVNLYLLKKVLSSFNEKFNPSFVCEFVAYSCCPEIFTLRQSNILGSLAKYLTAMVAQYPSKMGRAVDLVDRLVKAHSFDVLVPICSHLGSMERSEQGKILKRNALLLLKQITAKFPCVDINPLSNSVILRGPRWRMEQSDRYCTKVVSNIFESDDNDEIARSLDYLQQLIYTHPSVVVREFGMMVNQLSVILAKDTRDIKSDVRRLTIKAIRQTAIMLMPKLQPEDLQHVDTAITLLLAIFDRHAKGKEDSMENKLSEAIISLCYCYLEHHPQKGREMLAEQMAAIEGCCLLHPELPTSKTLLDQFRPIRGEIM